MPFSQKELVAKTRAAARDTVQCYSADYRKDHDVMGRELKARGIINPAKVKAIAERMLAEEEAKFEKLRIPTAPNPCMGRPWYN